MTDSKDLLDDILEILFHSYNARGNQLAIDEAKQQILTHYISYEEVERLIPEPIVFDDPELAEHNKDFTDGFNAAIAELKAALKKRRESK